MTDKTDPPIEEPGYLHGLTVVDIGDYRVSRGMTRRPFTGCHHHGLTYDKSERRIWCRDCERDVEPFDAFVGLAESYDRVRKSMIREREEIREAAKFNVRSLAAKAIDKEWRARKTVPICPHCHSGLFPEDFKNGIATAGREDAEAMRKRENVEHKK